MANFSVVLIAREHSGCLDAFLDSLAAQTIGVEHLEIVLVDTGFTDRSADTVGRWQRRYPAVIRYLHHAYAERAAACNAGLALASGEWVTFCDAAEPLPPDHFQSIDAFLRRHGQFSLALVYPGALASNNATRASQYVPDEAGPHVLPLDQLDAIPPRSGSCLFQREILVASDVSFDSQVRSDFEDTAFAVRYLLAVGSKTVGWVAAPGHRAEASAPDAETWGNKATYGAALVHGYLNPLEDAARLRGSAPRWLQRTVLRDLQWYFATDIRDRSPTAAVTEPMAVEFHELVRRVMSHIDVEAIESLDAQAVSLEVKHALLSYKGIEYQSPVAITAYDHDQGLVRLSYYIHGRRPSEAFLLDGVHVEPAYAKYRACNFFRRLLFRERIVWLPAGKATTLEVLLDGGSTAVTVGYQVFAPTQAPVRMAKGELLRSSRSAYPPGKGGQQLLPSGLPGLKARALRWLARHWPVRKKFANAWVFIDGDNEADDNAEHLYRWVRCNHPEINAWFLLSRSSPDWYRLASEGFRLIPQGVLRKVLMLNSDHIISSHVNYALGGLSRSLYGDLMNWRFTYLEHGVIKDDMSHHLSNQPFDLIVTTSPEEYASIIADDTPYTYTARETRRTGLPRHDQLLKLSSRTPPAEVNFIFVMPTWRAKLNKARTSSNRMRDPKATFAESEYVRSWRLLLRSDKLHEMVEAHGRMLVFMPHPGSVPYLDAFDVPAHVEVVTKKDVRIQQVFCRSTVMITDYSSVAFEMAYLRRPVVYYQFDREQFYGDHTYRLGYFDYDRDGFGPVATRQEEVIASLERILSNDAQPEPEYLARMERALPERDGQACKRVFESILEIRQPVEIARKCLDLGHRS